MSAILSLGFTHKKDRINSTLKRVTLSRDFFGGGALLER